MKVRYGSEHAMQLCTKRREAQKAFGEAGALRLGRRVKELEDADDSRELFEGPGRWHPLHGDRREDYAAEVTGKVRIIVWFPEHGSVVVVSVGNAYH